MLAKGQAQVRKFVLGLSDAVLLTGPLQRWPMSARSAPGKDALSTGSGPTPALPRPGQCCGLLVATPPLGGTPRTGVRRPMRSRAPARTRCPSWRLPQAATPVAGAICSSEGPWQPTGAPRRPKGPSRVTRPPRGARPEEPAFPATARSFGAPKATGPCADRTSNGPSSATCTVPDIRRSRPPFGRFRSLPSKWPFTEPLPRHSHASSPKAQTKTGWPKRS